MTLVARPDSSKTLALYKSFTYLLTHSLSSPRLSTIMPCTAVVRSVDELFGAVDPMLMTCPSTNCSD